MNPKKERLSMDLSLVPLLLGGQSISPEARQALRENRLDDAAGDTHEGVWLELRGSRPSPGRFRVR